MSVRRILSAIVTFFATTIFAAQGQAEAAVSLVSWTIPGTNTVCTFDPTLPTLGSVLAAQNPSLLASLSAQKLEIVNTIRTESACDSAIRVIIGATAAVTSTSLCYWDGTWVACDNDTSTEPSADSCPGYQPYGPWLVPPKFPGCVTAEIHLHTHFNPCREDYQTTMQLKMQVYDSSKTGGWTAERGNLHSANWSGTTSIYKSHDYWDSGDHVAYETIGDAASPDLFLCPISRLGTFGGLIAIPTEQIHTGYLGTWQLHDAGSSTVLTEDEYCFAADWDIFARLAISGECTQP